MTYFSRVALILIAVSFSGPMCAASCIDDTCSNVTHFESTGGAIEDDVAMLQTKLQLHEQQRKSSCVTPFYTTPEKCAQAAVDLGLQLGGEGYGFTGSYKTKGCYTYESGKYLGIAFFGAGGSTSQEKAAAPAPKIRLDCEAVEAASVSEVEAPLVCSTYNTPSNSDGQGGGFRRRRRNAQYLDRHNVACGRGGSNRKAMSRWELQTDSSARRRTQMHVKYKCCAPSGGLGSCSSYSTPAKDDGDGRSYYFDRHSVSCSGSKVIQSWKLQTPGNKFSFDYKCCSVPTGLTDCKTHYTAYSDDGDGNVVYLDRHDVRCPTNKALRYFRMYRSSNHKEIRYRYTCCAIRKPTTTTTTTITEAEAVVAPAAAAEAVATTTTTTATGNPDDYNYMSVGGGQCIDEDGETLPSTDPRSLGWAEPEGETPLAECKEICSRNLNCGAIQFTNNWCWLYAKKDKPYVSSNPYAYGHFVCYVKLSKS